MLLSLFYLLKYLSYFYFLNNDLNLVFTNITNFDVFFNNIINLSFYLPILGNLDLFLNNIGMYASIADTITASNVGPRNIESRFTVI